MQKIIAVLLTIVAIIHLLPVSGALGSERLAILYGLSFDEPNIAILMRHRAILFAILGLFFLYAAFKPLLQPLAIIAGLASTLSFIGMAWFIGGYNEALYRVVMADVIAVLCLLAASVLYIICHHKKL